jgi:hypothetical protein
MKTISVLLLTMVCLGCGYSAPKLRGRSLELCLQSRALYRTPRTPETLSSR